MHSPAPRPDTGPAALISPAPPRRRVLLAFALLGSGAALGVGAVLVLFMLCVRLSWPHTEPLGNPEVGINFSCNEAEYLLLEDPALGPAGYVPDSRPGRPEWCAQTLGALLTGTGARHVRLSVEWANVEPEPGQYDFRLIDALLEEATRDGARVLLTVGVKAQRSPEFYIPDWVMDQADLKPNTVISDDPFLHDRALAMIRAVVEHVAPSPAIEAWSADNEPYVASGRSHDWSLSRTFVAEEVATIHSADPAQRLVSVAHAQHFVFDSRWKDALNDGDALAASVYAFRNYDFFGRRFVVPILELGPLIPNYAAQARAAHAQGKPFWLTEVQAEPWVDTDTRLISPADPSPNLTPANFRKSIEYARRSGADRIYLWGSEWWLYQKEHYNDSSWWHLAREAIATSPGAPSG